MAEMAVACAFKCPFLDTILSNVDVDLSRRGDLVLGIHNKGGRIKGHVSRNFDAQAGVNCACNQGDRHLCLAVGEGIDGTARGVCCRWHHGHGLEKKKKNEKKWACAASVVHRVHVSGLDGCPSSSLRRSKGGLAKIGTDSLKSASFSC